ncbi:MAG: fused MFS/spermidine synthase [Hyphomicrobiaceae bacterium]|nr:fused MFS/spermidine synthase [Hyphomicrobiaceae bacterium]
MDAAALGQSLARRLAARRESRVALFLFAGTLFLSALLLFSVQPMFARMVLPRLGGSPSVWAVSMCFFQAVLLAGYCYAHALNRLVPSRWAPLAHLTLMGIAILALPIGLPTTWPEPPAGDAYLWLIGTLTVGVGLPFFAVSANAPLIQAWFARSGHPHASDPYFLYGASNLGSLIALLAYPIAIEPLAGLGAQASLWATGFVALGLALAACGLMMAVNERIGPGRAGTVEVAAHATPSPAWANRLAWIGLAAVPSGLLVAFTSYLTTDIASAPFLWVLPLAAFLATFILVFCDKPRIPHKLLLSLQPALVAAVLFGLATPGVKGWTIATVAGTGAFLVTTLVAHRELFERRPSPAHLTEFYLWMSLGGVLGGVFAALAAPQLFPTIWEFPLLLVVGMACRPGIVGGRLSKDEARELAVIGLGAIVAMTAIAMAMRTGALGQTTLPRFLLLAGFGIMAMLARTRPFRQLVATAVMGATIVILPSAMNRGNAERSFFGVHRVALTADREMRVLLHGTTVHGAERLVDAATGNRLTDPVPATYYHPGSPMSLGVGVARRATGKLSGGLEVGIVGLGAGSMACHSRPDEAWRFYEIDPVVVRIAQDASRFTFMARCRPNADIVVGDARLTLAREPGGRFDYLVVDAFSSDAVPVHLLTVEAVKLYLDKVAPDGLLALHVSNRHLDLVAVAAAVTAAVPGAQALLADDRTPDKGFDTAQSHVVYVSRSKATLDEAARLPFVKPMPAADSRAWTDDYSDILGAMLRKPR